MITYFELHEFASRVITSGRPPEADLRRGVSALYYGLFHRLTEAGSAVYAPGGAALQSQVSRAFRHGAMKELCRQYVRSPARPFKAPLDALAPTAPDGRLPKIAGAFADLQEARDTADYDRSAFFTQQFSIEMLVLANTAHRDFTDVEHLPETTVFLTALLLADRWTRRG